MNVTFRLWSDGYAIGESLNLFDEHPKDIATRVDAILHARLELLGNNFWILAIEGDGFAKRPVDFRGRGNPGDLQKKLSLVNEFNVDKISLRGVPCDFVEGYGHLAKLTPKGLAAVNEFSRVVKENGVYIVHLQEKRPITKLTLSCPNGWSTLAISHLPNKGKPTQLRLLKTYFGADRAPNLYRRA